MNPDQYFNPHRGRVTHIVDGDTLDAVIDLGFRTHKQVRVRLKDVDTAETYGVDHDSDEYERGVEQTEFVRQWIEQARTEHDGDWPFHITTSKDTGKFGRWPARIEARDTGESLNQTILEQWPSAVSNYE